ncbi:SGNH/GDSL hydrolase family protein [Streptomyces bottropensis]|uniref:SGNH/GDSL hydrolase family protein n=1 Tax=Streptomyces bottropensis TaxID=42235 RepID=UPI00368572DC
MDPWTAAHHPARYRADAVVIDLGTDDVGHGVSSAQFQAGCSSLLRTVRAAHPQAWIFARETSCGTVRPAGPGRRAAARRRRGLPAVLRRHHGRRLGSGDLTDSVHPNDRGHRVVADRLAPVIAARIGA